ncbi:MAG: family transcriptional regulator, partial [Variovorax sp.]|nr:family transcriptional regulator [Variovorax sp.]
MDTRVEPLPLPLGDRLRKWRERRHLSQMALALQAEVSTRHLSFVETGRAQPGRDLVLRLADELEIPLRERNQLLMAAGFAPVFGQRDFDDPAFDPVRSIIDITLERHKPFPAYVIDRHWNVVRSNSAVQELYEGVSAALMGPTANVVRIMLHPEGMAPRIHNLAVWRSHLLGEVRRQFELTADPTLGALLREAAAYPTWGADGDAPAIEWSGGPAVPLDIETSLGRLSFIGAVTVFGSPVDVTLEEIALELMHPANDFTDRAVRQSAASAT